MKKFVIIFLIALIHFGFSVLIVPMTMSVATAMDAIQPGPRLYVQILVAITRILHFPIIAGALYSRQWFPGDWIYVLIMLNSFIWAFGIYFLVVIYKKIIGKKNRNEQGKY